MSLWMNSSYSDGLTPHTAVRLSGLHMCGRAAGRRVTWWTTGWKRGNVYTNEAGSCGSLGVQQGRAQSQTHGVDTLHRFLAGFLPPAVNTEGVGGYNLSGSFTGF